MSEQAKVQPPYTTEEFAELTRRHPKTVRRWIREKRILATQLHTRQWLIPRTEAQRLFEQGANQ